MADDEEVSEVPELERLEVTFEADRDWLSCDLAAARTAASEWSGKTL